MILEITIVICFIITWLVIDYNSNPSLTEICTYKCSKECENLRNENDYLREKLRQMDKARDFFFCKNCQQPESNFNPYKERYYAVDKEKQDLVDIIVKSQKLAESLSKDLSLK